MTRLNLFFPVPATFVGVVFEQEMKAAGYDVLVSRTIVNGMDRVQVGGLGPGGETFGIDSWDAINTLLLAHDPSVWIANWETSTGMTWNG
jgi:hypothetical protein